jgi:quercetin dioxygenase-like cupin family protein
VLEGIGLVQRRGGPVQIIEPGEWHWHGAGLETAMAHVTLQERPRTRAIR